MNRFQQILGMAVALGGFAPSRFDYPYRPQSSVPRRRGKVGTIPGFVNCHCAKCDPDDEPFDPQNTIPALHRAVQLAVEDARSWRQSQRKR